MPHTDCTDLTGFARLMLNLTLSFFKNLIRKIRGIRVRLPSLEPAFFVESR